MKPVDRWRSSFGDSYVLRNAADNAAITARERAFARIFGHIDRGELGSILEVGCNIGINIRALRGVTDSEIFAVEPNHKARAVLLQDGVLDADHLSDAAGSALPYASASMDLVFTAGVLIHIPEPELQKTMREIHRVSRRFVMCLEYFSRDPVSVPYRGYDDMLFKRDFGGLYLDLLPDLSIVADGFLWRRSTDVDDLTWCLFSKTA